MTLRQIIEEAIYELEKHIPHPKTERPHGSKARRAWEQARLLRRILRKADEMNRSRQVSP